MSLKNLLAEKVREVKKTPKWFASSFQPQIDFILDKARFKTGLCTRRAGKSYGGGIYLFKEAWENPGVTCLYIAKTRDSAQNIMWKDVLKVIDADLGLGAKFNDARLRVTLPNGSEILLVGTDSGPDEMEKLRGQKFKLVIIDEGSTYRINVHQLVYKILKAALWDHMGTLAMIGTPTDFVESFFAKCTVGEIPGWSNHFWKAEDNHHVVEQYRADIAELKARDPNVEKKAWFRQEYGGEWVVSEEARIFHFEDEAIEFTEELPKYMRYVLGIHVTDKKKTAFTVVGYSSKLREALIVESTEIMTADINRIVKRLLKYEKQYGEFENVNMSGVTKRLVEELSSRFSVSVPEDIEKDIEAIVRLYQTELLQNNIKVLPGNADIVKEWKTIVKDDKSSKVLQFHPSCSSHRTIAALFAWFNCYNYTYEPESVREDPNDEYWENEAERISNPSRTEGILESGEGVWSSELNSWWRSV